MDPRTAGLSESKRALLEELRRGRLRTARPAPEVSPRRSTAGALSFAQQRLWFIHQIDPASAAYNVPMALRLLGGLESGVLKRCLDEIVRRHETLRTRFPREDGRPQQVVDPDGALEMPLVDLRGLPAVEREREAERLAAEDARGPFDLGRGPVARASLLRLGDDDHVFLLCMHHIVSDGWSVGVLMRELAALYEAFARGAPSPLPPLPMQYADFAAWQRGTLSGETLERELRWWRERLRPAPPSLELPADRPRPPVQTFRGGSLEMKLPATTADALRALARREGATLFMVLLAAFDALLSRLCGEDDVAVGTGVANRTRPEIEPLVGFFVNALVLRVSCAGDPTFAELVRRAKEATLGAFAHQDLPFERLVEELQPVRDLSRNPLFQVALALQNAPADDIELPGLVVRPLTAQSGATRFDLEFHLWEAAGGAIDGFLFYSSDLFDPATARRIAERWATLLEAAAADPERRVSALPVGTEEETRSLGELSRGRALAVEPHTAGELFARTVARAPGAAAVEEGDRRWTYAELDELAASTARRLRAAVPTPKAPPERVAVLAGRCVEQLASVLAAAKCGAAWVPLDPAQPDARLAAFTAGARADVVLATADLAERARRLGPPVVVVDRDARGFGGDVVPCAPTDLRSVAYVIFTSGSTGEPNGVEVPHTGLANLVAWHLDEFALSPADRTTWVAGPGFDASVWEVWPTLAAGACLLIPDEETRLDPERLRDWLVARRATVAFVPTPLAPDLVALSWPEDAELRVLLTGGDRLPALAAAGLPFRVVNNYGPTETTVVATSGPLDAGASLAAPTLGRPIANAAARVLDAHLRPVPIGVPGELFVGGAGVARGYSGRPDLTAARFLPDPFDGPPGARMYRTGDRVRLLSDGRLEFLGRLDRQAKIRGQRIEPGEVEAALGAHPGLRAAAAAVRTVEGEAQLVAWVVPREGGADDARWEADHVARWRELYDNTYANAPEDADGSFHIVGWNSSYTGEPIPAEEMREWRDATVRRILALGPRRVLEIGCGTGLLLTQIAPRCERYVATDLSRRSLEFVRRTVAARAELSGVELLERAADVFDGWSGERFDTVILNSVVQYFPDAGYLERVVDGALSVTACPGHVFVGDVRDLRLQRAFAESLLRHGRGEAAVEQLLAREEELLVDPAFFALAAARSPRPARARALAKRGRAENELTRFRYDVVLEVGEEGGGEGGVVEIPWSGRTLEPLREALAGDAPQVVLRGAPNARLARDADEAAAQHPDDLAALGDEHLRTGEVGLSAEHADRLDVAFTRAGVAPSALALRARLEACGDLTNCPLRLTRGAALVSQLRDWLGDRLPESMSPSAFVLLSALPLTPNGKIDRRALPAPEAGQRADRPFVEPRDDVERAVARAWADVLGVPRVSATEDFFELGGHSLRATQVLSRIRAALGVDLPLRAIFEHPTVEGLAAVARSGSAPVPGEEPLDTGVVSRRARRDGAPLSLAQQRLWFLDRLEPGAAAYHIPNALRLRGRLDAAALGRALTEIVRRHEALRTRFVEERGAPAQRIDPPYEVALSPEDVPGAGEAERVVAAESMRPFDLARGRVLRARLLRLAADDHVLCLVAHHIAADGWSMGVLVRELGALYSAFVAGADSPLPPLPIQYADWAVWQREWLARGALAKQLGFWRDALAGTAPLELPTDHPRPAHPTYAGAALELSLEPAVVERLRRLGRDAGATLHMTLLAAFAAVLARWSGQKDFAVGTPVAGRARPETEPLVGFFVNTLAVRMDLDGAALTFADLVGRVRETMLAAHAHQDVPFERIVEELRPERDTSRNPIFQTLFGLHNVDFGELALPGLALRPFALEPRTAQFDVELSLFETGAGISGRLHWSTDLFERETMERFAAHFLRLVAGVAAEPGLAVHRVPIVSEVEHRLLERFGHGGPLLHRGTALAMFEREADRDPCAPAVRQGGETLSYAQLDARADRLAHLLRGRGVGRGATVGVCLPRSFDLVAGVLAVRKAGAACLALDPAYPRDRLALMVGDARPALVITRGELAARLPDGAPLCRVDEEEDALARQPAARVSVPAADDDAAYVVYTSGSTGRPKGIVMREGTLANLVAWQCERSGRRPLRRTLQYASLSFDVSFQEIFATLAEGGTLVLLSQDERRDSAELLRVLSRERVNRLFVPFVALQALAEAAAAAGVPPALDEVITAGEQLRVTPALRRFFARLPGATLDNQYGPSEAHVVTAERLEGDPAAWSELPTIGRAVAGARVAVLDERLAPVPFGVLGQVFIGGPVLARGYVGRADLTAERFLPDPAAAGGRLYATGDLARLRPDGRLAFAGRRDRQVKVRGFRVEPAEIEAALAACPGVRDAVVEARPAGGSANRLVAWVLLHPDAPPAHTLKEQLARTLPDHLVPSVIVALEEFPRTPSGKIDRSALPAPPRPASEDRAPRSAEERTACALFAEVLEVPRAGCDDDFFELGGHSLLAVRLLSRANEAFRAETSLRVFFGDPTPAGLARAASRSRRAAASPLPALRRASDAERAQLSYSQRRLWFLDRLDPGGCAYNLVTALRLSGEIDADALDRALRELGRRHEALRTRFVTTDDGPRQVFDVPARDVLRRMDLRGEDDPLGRAERLAGEEARTPFDLERGPLWRARLLRVAERDAVLALAFHHIVTDGWSMDILLRELGILYTALSSGVRPALAEPTVQYADWAAWQREWLEGGELQRQLAYWREELQGLSPLALPTDRPRPARRGLRGGSVRFELDAADSRALARLAREEGATLFHALLSCFQALLSRFAGTSDIVVGTPMANRSLPDAEGIVGFFANTLALRLRAAPAATFRERLRHVRAKVLEAQDHQEAPFESIVEALAVPRDLSRNPIFDVMFALQHAGAAAPASDDLALRPVPAETGATAFDLSLALFELEGRIWGSLQFDADLFEQATAERLAAHFAAIVRAAARTPDGRLDELELRTGEGRVEPAASVVAGEAPGHERTLAELLEDSCRRHARLPAVEDERGVITYAELDARATALAASLRAVGVGAEVPVGLLAGRGISAVCGMAGIWRAGGVLVPLDPALPQARLALFLDDAGIGAVLAERGLESALGDRPAAVLPLEPWKDSPRNDTAGGASGADARPRPANGAYVVFTSGSTGTPKGSVVEHRAIAAHAVAAADAQQLGPADRALHALPLTFDAALDEILPALVAGATLVVHPDPRGDTADDFLERCGRERITVAHVPLDLFHDMALEIEAGRAVPSSLRHVVLGGEPPRGSRIAAFLRRASPRAVVTNAYGPTEAVVAATRHEIRSAGQARDPVPIGTARPGTVVHLLDARLYPVPLGAVGEIFLAGPVLARGYARRPDATAAAFLPDPFSRRPGARMYRTGDQGRRLADGTLVFVGRRDGQVKLRGFRVELGEVEAALHGVPGVRAAAADVRGSRDDPELVAWVAALPGFELTPAVVRVALRDLLPGTMIPSRVLVVERIPTNAHGKVDRTALADVPVERRSGERIGPRDEGERALAPLWCEILGLNSVEVTEDFFDAGGNSLRAVRLVTAVRRRLGRDVQVATLFRHPTFEDFARALHGEEPATARLTRLRSGAGLAPFVCFSGIGGAVSDFRRIAAELDPARGVFAVPVAVGPALRVEDLAAAVLPAILEAVPEGPVHLLGWSYGGLVAFEAAKRLRAAGRDVGALLLVDALGPGSTGRWTTPAPHAADAPGDEVGEWVAELTERLEAAKAYRPEPWKGDAVLLRGTESVTRDVTDGSLGWSDFIDGELVVEWAPGSHVSILRGEGARAVAAAAERHASGSPTRTNH
jgi:amino acid adenylation domain-containing protein